MGQKPKKMLLKEPQETRILRKYALVTNIVRSSKLGFDVPLATALCKNRHAENYSTVVDQVKTPKGCSVD